MMSHVKVSKHLDKKFLTIILLWAIVFSLFIGSSFFITWKFEDRGTALKELGEINTLVLTMPYQPYHTLTQTFTQLEYILHKLQNNSVFCCQNKTREFQQFQQLLTHYTHYLRNETHASTSATPVDISHTTTFISPSTLAQQIVQMSNIFAQQIDTQNTQHIQIMRGFRWGLVALITFSFVLSFKLLKRFFLQPLSALNLGLVQVKKGNLQTRIKLPSNIPEWNAVAQEFNQMTQELEKSRDQQYRKETAILEERNLIAQRLHDSVAQSLAFVKMQASALKQECPTEVANSTHFTLMEKGISHCHEDIRSLLQNFRHKIAYDDFSSALISVLNQYRQLHHLNITESINLQQLKLDEDQQLQIIFILQETLSNIVKHAHATQVWVTTQQTREKFQLTIHDNGHGFDLQQPISGEHIGLAIMKERAKKIKAQLSIQSNQTDGTTLTLCIPQEIIL